MGSMADLSLVNLHFCGQRQDANRESSFASNTWTKTILGTDNNVIGLKFEQ